MIRRVVLSFKQDFCISVFVYITVRTAEYLIIVNANLQFLEIFRKTSPGLLCSLTPPYTRNILSGSMKG